MTEPARSFWTFPESMVTPAWAAKRRLAARVRELISHVVLTGAPAEVLDEVTSAVDGILERLRAQPQRTTRTVLRGGTPEDLAYFADRATLVGQCNPVAPPLSVSYEGQRAIGHVTFGPAFEGGPGWVHGGLVAAAFDQVFGHLQTLRGVASVTGSLTVSYRKPTPIETALRFEAESIRTVGRRHVLGAKLFARGEVVAEAEALFVEIERDRMRWAFASGAPEGSPDVPVDERASAAASGVTPKDGGSDVH
jgi:acyl-coenzyme A thioesterase PaaI-like protein